MFATSMKGATALADWYSVIETAKANGLEPYKYLVYLLAQLFIYKRGKGPRLSAVLGRITGIVFS